MTITISNLATADWKEYKLIRLETLKNAPHAFSSKYSEAIKYENTYWIGLLEDKNNLFILAKFGKTPIGIIRITINDNEEDENTAVLGGFYVSEAYRGRGVGALLAENALKSISKLRNINKVRLYVKPSQEAAISLYENNSFEMLGAKDGEYIMDKSNLITT